MKKYCKKCGKKLGNTNKIGYCQDCKKLGITKLGIYKCIAKDCNNKVSGPDRRCHKCAGLKRIKPAQPKPIYYCIEPDCKKEVSGPNKRCNKCKGKGNNNGNYKDGRTLKKYYCKNPECKKEIGWHTKTGLCNSCCQKGKKYSEERIEQMSQVMKDFWNSERGEKLKKRFSIEFTKENNPDRYKNRLKLLGKDNPNWKDKVEVHCIFCDKLLYITPQTDRLYKIHTCSKKCFKKWCSSKILDKNSNWKNGKSFEPYPLGWTKTFKEQIRDRDNHICQLCGMTEKDNGRKLDVHHTDYNKKNLDPKNMISLCHFCHPITNGNREYWRNYFYALLSNY